MLENIAAGSPAEALKLAPEPAFFETPDGVRTSGEASVTLSRASIALRFVPRGTLVVPKAAYGESTGRVSAESGRWSADRVDDAGPATSADARLFGTMGLRIASGSGAAPAATRLTIAGAAWNGEGMLGARRIVARALSRDVTSHHDRRMTIAVEDDLDETGIETFGRACSFVTGIDVEILSVERIAQNGSVIEVDHRRGYRRLGRGIHSPFTGVPDEDRMRAFTALAGAFPALLARGVPIDMIVDQISAHNQVAQIHVSALLLLMATVTAANQALHGDAVGAPSASRRAELERLDADLRLGLGAQDVERFEKIRVELLDGGFFHKPGYETGRPQRDIKFLRDIAHTVVFRLCGYTGPFYGAERFAVSELAGSPQ